MSDLPRGDRVPPASGHPQGLGDAITPLVRQLAQAVDEGLVVYDRDQRCCLWNHYMERLSGLTADEVLGRRPGEIFPCLRGAGMVDRVQAALRGEYPAPAEFALPVADPPRWIAERVSPLLGDDGAVVAAVAAVHDVTDRRQTEELARVNETRYRAMFDRAADGILLMAADGSSAMVNASFARMHGHAAGDMTDVRLEQLDTPASARRIPERLARLLAGEALEFETEHFHRDGHAFPLRVSCQAIEIEGQTYLLGFHHDLTRTRQAEAALGEANEILDTLFEHSPIGLEIYDRSATMLRANRQVAAMFGVTLAPQYGRFNLRQDPNYQDPEVWSRLDRGEEVQHEIFFDPALAPYPTTKTGCSWYAITTTPIDAAVSARVGYLMQIVDITDRKRDEDRAMASLAVERVRNVVLRMHAESDWHELVRSLRDELRPLVGAVVVSVAILDLVSGTTTFHYPQPPEGGVAHLVPRLFPALQRALQTGLPAVRRNRDEMAAFGDNITHAQTRSVIDVPFGVGTLGVGSPVEDGFGAREVEILQRFAQVLTEAHQRLEAIAWRRRAETEMAQQRLRAVQVDRLQALGEMATGIAHEINQPLNGIRSFADGVRLGLARGWVVDVARLGETMSDIVVQVDRISDIIDHMRVFARGQTGVDRIRFNVAAPITGALKLMGAQLRGSGITIEQTVADDLPWCEGWPNAIEQVVLNLLSNARDALEERRLGLRRDDPTAAADWSPKITIGAAAAATVVRMWVADNGGGISRADEARIFDPFFTTKDIGKGTGLGLAISRSIVTDRHGGQIEVDNRPGEGVTFYVVLPAVCA